MGFLKKIKSAVADPKGAVNTNVAGAKEIINGRKNSAPDQQNNTDYTNPPTVYNPTGGSVAGEYTYPAGQGPNGPVPVSGKAEIIPHGDTPIPIVLKPGQRPLVAPGTFADTSGVPAQILAERQAALTGLGQQEIVNRREQFLTGIEGTRATAAAELGRRQQAGHVTGGIAFAQQQAVNNAALGARATAERDLSIADSERRRQALNELQGYVGSERYGGIATDLAGRQLDMQQSAQDQQSKYSQEILDILRNRAPETLPETSSGGGVLSGNIGQKIVGGVTDPKNLVMGAVGTTAGLIPAYAAYEAWRRRYA